MGKSEDLVICAECGVQVGTGHVMRCLALAQAWKRSGGAVTFLVPGGLTGIEARIRAEGIRLETLPKDCGSSAQAFIQAALSTGARIAVLDGYGFGASEQSRLSDAGVRVLMVDDYGHASSYPACWILNQNAYALPEMYAGTNARLLLGSNLALLRDEFLPWIGWRRPIPDRYRKLLITIGGSDPDNASEKILQSFGFMEKDLEIVLVVGGGNPHLRDVQVASERCPVPVRVVQSVQDMPALMAWADVAISGAGGTSYELCYMGLPSLLLIIAENQRRTAERLDQLGVAVNAGTSREFHPESFASLLMALLESPQRREAMSQGARELVDGLGSERVRAALVDRELKLRPVRESDCRLLFGLAIDPDARAASFHSDEILWEDHARWFEERVQDPHSVIYIGEDAAGEAVGLVRFQIKGDRAVLSVNVVPEYRGKGWGRELIAFSTRRLVRTRSVGRIEAFVKPENQASVRLFQTSGFRLAGNDQVGGQDALLFTWESRTHAD